MAFYKKKTPLMESRERELMEFFLHQIKRWKGLTSIIATSGGINGKWINPNSPYEITSTKGMRMVCFKAAYQEEDEFIQDALEFRQFSIEFCKINGLTPNRKPKSRRKQ
jgi:hypothetical protein